MPMIDQKYNSVLDARPYELTEKEKGPLFYKNLLEELVFHYENNAMYKKFCEKESFNPKNFQGEISNIPPIPVHVFKALGSKLASVKPSMIKTQLQSSATSGTPSTILLDKITAHRQIRAMARVIQEILGPKKRPFCIMDIDPSSSNKANLGARLAAVSGYLNFASNAEYFIDAFGENAPLEFLEEKFIQYIKTISGGEPIVIFGFTFVLYEAVFRVLKENNIILSLPKGSQVIHIGGWKKLESQKVSKKIFNSKIASVLGIPTSDIIDIYGFTEQMGLNYPDCKFGWKHLPAYAEVLIRSEVDLSVCPDGESGLLEFLSPLQHSYPGNVVLTDDIGIAMGGTCGCGSFGRRFQVIGRAEKAEIRGCGEIMSEKINKKTSKSEIVILKPSLDVFHSPIKLNAEDTPLEQLRSIIGSLKKKQVWLSAQPSEAILGLVNMARKAWMADEKLDQYRDVGLNFLSDWSEPSRISNLLDASLLGQRGHLDCFLPRKDLTHSSLKALPRGLVCHWLSGNVPLLGMFALIQSILSKNVNILKVSAEDSQALPLILDSFKGLIYTTPGGYQIHGDELLETLAVVYFDRNQTELAEYFSSNSDARIAWGGREAIESISSLPKKFTTQDVLFGPKLSMMVVGKDALNSERSIRKLVRRAAMDSSVFDQFACASPHTIFVEKGGVIEPKEFAELLAAGMKKALIQLPTASPGKSQANKIRSKISEYGFIGDSWSDEHLRWTVLYSEDSSIVEPTYQRVITVKGVDDIYDIVDGIHEDIQTVGLAITGERRLDFANKITQKGAMRCPDIGFMTHFDSPWDGVFILDRLVRWVSLGGPI